MERLLRGIIQVGGLPDQDDCLKNWLIFREHSLDTDREEDQKIVNYADMFYSRMSAPPDMALVKEYFEKADDIETVARLDEISKAQVYIRTNYLSIARSVQEQQQIKKLVMICREAGAIAEHGRHTQAPGGKSILMRGVNDAVNFIFERLPDFTRVEGGEKLEGVVSEDADEVIDEYELTKQTNMFANRLLFGLEPVDFACKGHRAGEFWVHVAFTGELKCLAGDATVYDHAVGRRRTMKELHESGDMPVLTSLYREGREMRLLPAKASHLVTNGVRPVYELRLESGRRTAATSNHRFMTLNGWKELGDIREGDWLAVPRQTRVSEPNRSFSDEEVKIVGFLLGDGTVSNYIALTATNESVRDEFVECLRTLGYEDGPAGFKKPNFRVCTSDNRAPGVRVSKSPGGVHHRQVSPVRLLLERLGTWGRTAPTKEIPDEFYGLSEHQTALLLGSLWATDGSVHVGDHERPDRASNSCRNDLKYYSISENLCLGVQSLLLRLGIRSNVTSNRLLWRGEEKTVYVTRVVGAASKKRFIDLIQIPGKDHKLDFMNARLDEADDTPYPSELVPKDAVGIAPCGSRRYASQIRGRVTVSAAVLESFRHIPAVRSALDGDVLWERVSSVRLRGEEMTYDLEVPEHHSFLVDDIVTHNTTLAANYVYNNAYVYGKNMFYGEMEMPYIQLRRQLYIIHSSHGKFVNEWNKEDGYTGLDYRKVRDGELSPRDFERLKIVAQDFKANCKGKLYVWRSPEDITTTDFRRKAEMFHNKYGCDGVIIDHMGLFKPTRSQKTSDFVTTQNNIVRDCRMLALNFARGKTVPVLALSQMNRQGKMRADKNDGHYDFASISYANEIEKSADVITYTYLNDELRKEGKFYLGNLKNRDNPVFDRMIGKIFWQSKRMRHMETGLIDPSNDHVLSIASKIQLTAEDMLHNGAFVNPLARVA